VKNPACPMRSSLPTRPGIHYVHGGKKRRRKGRTRAACPAPGGGEAVDRPFALALSSQNYRKLEARAFSGFFGWRGWGRPILRHARSPGHPCPRGDQAPPGTRFVQEVISASGCARLPPGNSSYRCSGYRTGIACLFESRGPGTDPEQRAAALALSPILRWGSGSKWETIQQVAPVPRLPGPSDTVRSRCRASDRSLGRVQERAKGNGIRRLKSDFVSNVSHELRDLAGSPYACMRRL